MLLVVSDMTFAELLADAMRRHHNLTKASLARYAGVSESSVGRWLRGTMQPDPASCRILAQYFEMPEELFLVAAGHLSDSAEKADEDLPLWLVQALPLLKKLDSDEARVVEGTAQSLLELREARAKYGEGR